MLVLSRKANETIVIDGNIRITVVSLRGNQVRLGIEAPAQVKIFRQELCSSAPEVRHDQDAAPSPRLDPSRRAVQHAH
jgi:carbon storage regulator